jgi:hypothetical protein
MAILPKAIYKFDAIPTKISMTFFRNRRNKPESPMEAQKTLNIHPGKKSNVANIAVPDFKL